ncbi:hypothetical protein FBU59_003367 [Linderina macrospora]|uniref:Uncharacterized protein n=1 Tax=Linderina macrospora TaxID=4868 RepID=A0ACC1J8J3_9FUNG|nr:hypothetical protein FBU59_003367 [Linderina macrospora]
MTPENSLEDFASILRLVKTNPGKIFPVPVKPYSTIITAGGSYPGTVAAWLRAKYPELVKGAWTSSALIKAQYELYMYDQMAGKRLNDIGCGPKFAQAVKEVDQILYSGNTTAIRLIEDKFNTPYLTPRDFGGLVGGLTTIIAMNPVLQGFDQYKSLVCDHFDGTRSDIDAYALAFKDWVKFYSYSQNDLNTMANTSYNQDNTALGQNGRVWIWQACTWFGNWQVAPPVRTHLTPYRSRLTDLDYFQPPCVAKFGDVVKIPVDVAKYNRKWYNILKGVKNILYTVGSYDVWRETTAGAVYSNVMTNTTNSPIIIIEGATHAQDLASQKPNEIDSVKWAREFGVAQVKKWISS